MCTSEAFKNFIIEWNPHVICLQKIYTLNKNSVFIAQIYPQPTPHPLGSRYLSALFWLCEFACFRKSIAVRSCDTLISFSLSLEAFYPLCIWTPPHPLLFFRTFDSAFLASLVCPTSPLGSVHFVTLHFSSWDFIIFFSCYTFSDLVLSACFNMLLKPSGEFF